MCICVSRSILSWLLLILLGFCLVSPIADPDLWWHLSVGKWIISNCDVPKIDYWNRFSGESPWIAYSWLIEICFALIDKVAGLKGLYLAQAILGAFYVCVLHFVFLRLSKNRFFSLTLTASVIIASYPFFSLRPQTLSWILFAILLYILESREKRTALKNILCVCLIFLTWANSHITSCIGLACLFICVLPSKKSEVRFFLYCPLLAFFATLCTPSLGKEWFVLFSKYNHAVQHTYIDEFHHASLRHIGTSINLGLSIYLLLQTLQSHVTVRKLIFCVSLLIASLISIKFTPYSLICSGTLLAKYSNIKKTHFSVTLAITGLLIFYYCTLLSQKGYASYTSPEMVPDRALDFIMKNELPHPILHDFNVGGYVAYRFLNQDGSTRHKAIIDGRTNVNHPKILAAFLDAWNGNKKWKRYFRLTGAKTVLWPKNGKLVELLSKEKDWCQVYPNRGILDENWVVFVRKDLNDFCLGNPPQ